jgi:uncharacterized iron-regulated membrane protein
MTETFRQSMCWLHTWSGVVLGLLLFTIFWMGTLSVFDREIDRWMQPDTRLAVSPASVDLERIAEGASAVVPEGARRLQFMLPTEREPVVRLLYQKKSGELLTRHLHPATGAVLPEQGSLAGTGFIYPFHYSLHVNVFNLGYWLVGLAGMAMLMLLVSGVIIHSKLFVDFFTFRWQRKLSRASLDLHNLSGVLGLPFHFVITLSGLIIFFNVYFPQVPNLAYAKEQSPRAAFLNESYGSFSRPPVGLTVEPTSLNDMLAHAEREWGGGRPYLVRVFHPGDAASYVELRRSFADRITMHLDEVFLDAVTGEMLFRFKGQPVMSAQRFVSGLHFIQFDHWPLRWLYFVLGLAGCVMIATGYIYWLEARRKRHAKLGLPGVRIVEGLTIGSVTGLVIATLSFFVGNRLLAPGVSFAGYERAALEVWAFYLVWLATFAHAWMRPRRAWREQCWVIAGLAVLAPVLNWVTTGDHLLQTVVEGYWAVAGMDLLLLLGAGIAVYAALRLSLPHSVTGVVAPKVRQGTAVSSD